MRIGTNCFRSKQHADRYFSHQGYKPHHVQTMIDEGGIRIAAPDLKKGDSYYWDSDGRAQILTPHAKRNAI